MWCVSLAAPLHVERIRAVVFGERADDRLGRNPHLEGDQLYLLHRLAVIGQLELPGHQAGFLEPVQVHVQQRPGRAQPPRGAWPGRRLGTSRPLLYMHLDRLEKAGLVTGQLELSDDGKAMK